MDTTDTTEDVAAEVKPVETPKPRKKAKPKQATAEKPSKDTYHLPEHGISVEASSYVEAVRLALKQLEEK